MNTEKAEKKMVKRIQKITGSLGPGFSGFTERKAYGALICFDQEQISKALKLNNEQIKKELEASGYL